MAGPGCGPDSRERREESMPGQAQEGRWLNARTLPDRRGELHRQTIPGSAGETEREHSEDAEEQAERQPFGDALDHEAE